MTRTISARTLAAAGALIAFLALAASQASAVIVHESNGHFLGVMPHRGVSATQIPGSVAAQHASAPATPSGTVSYNGGPVLHSSDPYLIFWTPSGETIASNTESLLERYFTDVAADSGGGGNVFGVDRQYTDTTGYANYSQTFSSSNQAIVDTHAYPATNTSGCPDVSTSYPTCLDDVQLQTEIKRLISADGLPTGTGANAPIYLVVLPADVNECADAADCADNVFCAYHSSLVDSGSDVLYAAIPTLLAATDPKSCQADGNTPVQKPNGDQVGDVAITYTSHEDNESITDPLGTGWWNTGSGNETSDECIAYGSTIDPANGNNPNAFAPTLGGSASAGTLYDQLISAERYYTQSQWSNGDDTCELRPAGTVSASFTAPTGMAGASVSFDPSASSTSASGYSSVSWDFGDGTTSFSRTTSLATASHTYAAAGSYTVKLTLVDADGDISTASHQVTISPARSTTTGSTGTTPPAGGQKPAAAFSVNTRKPGAGERVAFDGLISSASGGSIVSYAWSFGDGTTGTGARPSHVYKKAGTYTVTLGVVDGSGSMAIVSHTVTIAKAGITAIALTHKTAHGATVLTRTNGPGTVFAGGRSFRLRNAGIAKLALRLSNAQRLKVKFVPTSGSPSTRTITIRL